MFCKHLKCLLYWWKYPTGIENQVAVGFADLHQEDETEHMQIWENRQPLLFIGPNSVHCLVLSVITMRLSPLQSVNRTIYQNVYLAPHLFAAQLSWQIFEENIWSLSLSLHIWPLESWTIIAIIRFNCILRTIWGRVEC